MFRSSARLVLPVAAIAFTVAPVAASAARRACARLPVGVAVQSVDPTQLLDGPRVLVTPRRGASVANLRVQLTRAGDVYASGRIAGPLAKGSTSVLLRPNGGRVIGGGGYRLVATGRVTGCSQRPTVTRDVRVAASSPSPAADPYQQHAVVDWSGGAWQGRDAAGFVLPGIGYGELVCNPNAQWIRVFPSDAGREVAMLNWTYRDWGGGQEKALREALHAPGTGLDFREGLNKFAPPEKHSTGEFDGIVTDRGVFGGPGGGPFAPPVTLRLTWAWDFSSQGQERCHAQASLVSEAGSGEAQGVRSASLVWRGDANAMGRDSATVDLPGEGSLSLTCAAGPDGTRILTLSGPQGAAVTTREGSDDGTVSFAAGPVYAALPNNGMLSLVLADGRTLLVTSRWKVNDPNLAVNFCFVAAQLFGP